MASIIDCKDQQIKIGKTSITIKNAEDGKTKGIVRDITKFKDLQPNKQIDYFKKLKQLNVWNNKRVDMNGVLISDGKIVILRNMKSHDFYTKYKNSVPKYEVERQIEVDKFYEELSGKVLVINCYF